MWLSFFAKILLLGITMAVSDWSIPLEYSVQGSQFQSLGTIQIRKMIDGNYSGEFTSPQHLDTSLKTALQQSPPNTPSYKVRSGNLTSSNLPCLFLLSNLSHEVALSLDPERQFLHSMTIFPANLYDISLAEAADQCSQKKNVAPMKLSMHVTVNSIGELPGPDTSSYLQRIEDEKKARQHGANQDNRSFLAKYWMYIVPVVIFMFVSNIFQGDQTQGE